MVLASFDMIYDYLDVFKTNLIKIYGDYPWNNS